MDRRETFILTIFHDPHRMTDLRGRVRHVASGYEASFIGIAQLAQILRKLLQKGKEGKDERSA
ncbi:MAG TPA: hypothetical protein ENG33_06090 [Chloroflexi bacterium]|nr:hypothetical protein [Chloroflexota bacterium]